MPRQVLLDALMLRFPFFPTPPASHCVPSQLSRSQEAAVKRQTPGGLPAPGEQIRRPTERRGRRPLDFAGGKRAPALRTSILSPSDGKRCSACPAD